MFSNLKRVRNNIKGSCKDEDKKKLHQLWASNRAKAKIKRLIRGNRLSYHWVTTYSDDMEDRNKSLYDNREFMKRLSRQQGKKINFVAVPEIQEKRFKKYGVKVYHMHIALENEIDARDFWSVWNNKKCLKCELYNGKRKSFQCKECKYFKGVIYVKNRNDANIEKTAGYFGKYFSKGFDDKDLNQRKFMQKRYLRSKGLKMPEVEKVYIIDKNRDLIEKEADRRGYHKKFTDGGSYNDVNNIMLEGILSGEKEIIKIIR